MNLEKDHGPFLIVGILFGICASIVVIGGMEKVGLWMYSLYPIFLMLSVACLSISWIRWKNQNEKI